MVRSDIMAPAVPASMASAQDTVYSTAMAEMPAITPPRWCFSAESMTSARPTGYTTVVTALATSTAAV